MARCWEPGARTGVVCAATGLGYIAGTLIEQGARRPRPGSPAVRLVIGVSWRRRLPSLGPESGIGPTVRPAWRTLVALTRFREPHEEPMPIDVRPHQATPSHSFRS